MWHYEFQQSSNVNLYPGTITLNPRCVRLERDVKQKRHLIEDQRQKLKHMKETVSKSEEKMVTLICCVVSFRVVYCIVLIIDSSLIFSTP